MLSLLALLCMAFLFSRRSARTRNSRSSQLLDRLDEDMESCFPVRGGLQDTGDMGRKSRTSRLRIILTGIVNRHWNADEVGCVSSLEALLCF